MAGWHSWLAVALCVMVVAHVAGVAAESLLLKAPLVRAMITGWILLPADVIPTNSAPSPPNPCSGAPCRCWRHYRYGMGVGCEPSAARGSIDAGQLSLPVGMR